MEKLELFKVSNVKLDYFIGTIKVKDLLNKELFEVNSNVDDIKDINYDRLLKMRENNIVNLVSHPIAISISLNNEIKIIHRYDNTYKLINTYNHSIKFTLIDGHYRYILFKNHSTKDIEEYEISLQIYCNLTNGRKAIIYCGLNNDTNKEKIKKYFSLYNNNDYNNELIALALNDIKDGPFYNKIPIYKYGKDKVYVQNFVNNIIIPLSEKLNNYNNTYLHDNSIKTRIIFNLFNGIYESGKEISFDSISSLIKWKDIILDNNIIDEAGEEKDITSTNVIKLINKL